MDKKQRACKKHAKKLRKITDGEMRSRDQWVTKRYGTQGHAACGKKRRYDTKTQAMSSADKSYYDVAERGCSLHAYRCPFCDGWHITHHEEDLEFWTSYVRTAEERMRERMDDLVSNDLPVPNMDYTTTRELAIMRARTQSRQPAELMPRDVNRRRHVTCKKRLEKRRLHEMDDMIRDEGLSQCVRTR